MIDLTTYNAQTQAAIAKREEAAAAEKAAERQLVAKALEHMAAMAQASTPEVPLPTVHMCFASSFAGRTEVHVRFRARQPDELRALMTVFPACEAQHYRGGGSAGFHDEGDPVTRRGLDKATETGPASGYRLEVTHPQRGAQVLRMTWRLAGQPIHITADVSSVHAVTPTMKARRVTRMPGVRDAVYKIEGPFVEFPQGLPEGCAVQRYAQIDAYSWPTHYVYGRGNAPMLAMVAGWVDKCATMAAQSWAAYQADKAAGVESNDRAREVYNWAPKALRAGTLAQWQALRTPEALAAWALYQKHPRCYARDHGLTESEGYADHYTWALAWLERVGLLHDDCLLIDGKPYKYGAAWLTVEQANEAQAIRALRDGEKN